jgi:hypothetical protein
VTSSFADKVSKMTPADLRELIPMMTDDEIRDFLLYFRIGVLSFLEDLARRAEEAAPVR